MNRQDIKSIRLTKTTYDKVKKLGVLGETFDDVISRLVENQK